MRAASKVQALHRAMFFCALTVAWNVVVGGAAVATAELFLRAQLAFSASIRNRLESLLVAAGLYWLLTSVFTFFQSRLERRISKGDVRTEIGGGGARRRTQFIPADATDVVLTGDEEAPA